MNEARKLITNAAAEAKVVLATTSERKRYASTAVIVGPTGEPLFHIVSTWWSRIVVVGYGVMLGIIMLLTVLVYYNKSRLNTLEEKVDENKTESQQRDEQINKKSK